MSHRPPLVNVVAALLIACATLSAQNTTVQYVYDEVGRLVAVIDQNGDAAVYRYDAAGNLVEIAVAGMYGALVPGSQRKC